MNWNTGLRRLSAAVWGLLGFVVVVSGISIGGSLMGPEGVAVSLGYMVGFTVPALLLIYGLHRGTCWVIAGFFASKTPP